MRVAFPGFVNVQALELCHFVSLSARRGEVSPSLRTKAGSTNRTDYAATAVLSRWLAASLCGARPARFSPDGAS